MSLWDDTVRPVLLSRPLPRASLAAVALQCIMRVVETCSSKWELEVPKGDLQRLSNAVEKLSKSIIKTHDSTVETTSPRHEKLIKELEELLPDEDSHLTYASGWSCAIQSVIDLAMMQDGQSDLMAMASDSIDLAYQAATRDAVQGAIRTGGRAIGEEELKKIETSLPVCQNEIAYQIQTLQSHVSSEQ